MSYATFNGWTIIPYPSAPGFVSVALGMNDTVASTTSPFTATSQTQIWPGADWWDADVQLPKMFPAQAAAWRAWLAALQGKANVFMLGDPTRRQPINPVSSSTPVINTSGEPSPMNIAGSSNIYTRGWRPSQARILSPGDHIQIGLRLHVVLQAVTSDARGNAAINLWPTLREQPADGAAIILNNPMGLFRLADNARRLSLDVTRLMATGFKCVEAR